MKRRLFLLAVIFITPLVLRAQLYRTTVHPPPLRQSALELRNTLSVLTIAMVPGDEDLSLMADLRSRRGAKILSTYVTNGEAGESDVAMGYPNQFAANLRREATKAMDELGAETCFLNLADIGAARDSAIVYQSWNPDTVEIRLMRLISSQRPHLVVLFPERRSDLPHEQWICLKRHLLNALRRLNPPSSLKELSESKGIPAWSVQRLVAGSLVREDVTGKHPGAAEARALAQYASLRVQLPRFRDLWKVEYQELLPLAKRVKRVDSGLPYELRGHLRNLAAELQRFANSLGSRLTKGRESTALRSATALEDSVAIWISTHYGNLSRLEQKTLLLWKESLQDIKNALLGISVSYSLNEQIITNRQVTYLRIDSLKGVNVGNSLWLYFPGVKDGWIFNETVDQRLPIDPRGGDFRLVSPASVLFNLPADVDGMERNTIFTPINLFVVRSENDRARNFVMKIALPFQFAPKFTAEPLTPVVRAVTNEVVIVRLTNHSRDGVRSQVEVDDSLVTSQKEWFRLSQKEGSVTDTLRLTWKSISPGTHLVNVSIEGVTVAHVAARSFDLSVDTTKWIGLISSFDGGATSETLRRIGMRYDQIAPGAITRKWLASHDAVILDRRVLSLSPLGETQNADLQDYAAKSGYLIVLAQDAAAWNQMPLIPGVHLDSSGVFDAFTGVDSDTTDQLLERPNRIQDEDWSQWLWYRAYNKVTLDTLGLQIPVKERVSGSPFVVRAKRGKGTITYVDLALPLQWLNIHAGAFRLIANLLSY